MDGPGTGAGHANQQQSKVQVSRARHQSAGKEHNTAKVPCRVSSFNHAE